MNVQTVFKGDTGKYSTMRVSTLIVVCTVMGVFAAHNLVAIFRNAGFVSIGASEAILLAGVLGAKAAQHYGERKNIIPTDKTQ